MQTRDGETSDEALDTVRPLVILTTTDTSLLLPALLVAGASVTLQRDQLAVRGLTAVEVAGIAAVHLALVTDLTSSTPSPFVGYPAVLSEACRQGPAPVEGLHDAATPVGTPSQLDIRRASQAGGAGSRPQRPQAKK